MQQMAEIQLLQFIIVYALLLIVVIILRYSKINQTKELLIASVRMTLQLVIAGLILTYILENPAPVFTILYIIAMLIFATVRTFRKTADMGRRFKICIALSLSAVGVLMLAFFVVVIVRESFFNPQYAIPLAGMMIGNAMTGLILGLNSFSADMQKQKLRISVLTNMGVHPKDALRPFVQDALSTALLPTINGMVGMGIVFLPGLMTGQILAGVLPMTAIMYQIAILIAITAAVAMTTFFSLHFGYQTVYDKNLCVYCVEENGIAVSK